MTARNKRYGFNIGNLSAEHDAFKATMGIRQGTFNSRVQQKREDNKMPKMKSEPIAGKLNFYGMKRPTITSKRKGRGTPSKKATPSKRMGASSKASPSKSKAGGGKNPWNFQNPAVTAGIGAIAGTAIGAFLGRRKKETTTYNIYNKGYGYVPRY